VEAPLTPRAAERLSRESAAQGSFANAGRALEIDWGVALDGRQVQRWADELGQAVVRRQDRVVLKMEEGHHPAAPPNDPQLLVIELDGGRVQTREKNPQTQSRWREDKVCTVTTYQPGRPYMGRRSDGAEKKPVPLVTTHVATMRRCEPFGRLCRLEAERRGLRQAEMVLALGDGGNFIDPLLEREFRSYVRIIDWRHAQEHLWDCAKAIEGVDSPRMPRTAKGLETLLWKGKVKKVIAALTEYSRRLGEPENEDGPDHPRRVLRQNVGYFTNHQDQMNYPEYRRRGWPIGSGVVESGVKQFNKRVKGSDQFWNEPTLEPILALRGLWLSQDQRWTAYWSNRTAYDRAA
jgi:hypothetical protein